MKTTSPFLTLCLSVLFTLFGSSAFSQESAANIKSGSVEFASGSADLSPEARRSLSTLQAQMRDNPSYRVVLTGSAGGSKPQQQLNANRVEAVVEYMTEQLHIDRGRFVTDTMSSDIPSREVHFNAAETDRQQ